VLTVSVEVPKLLSTEMALNEHAGIAEPAGEPLSVMLLQESARFELSPFSGPIVMVEVADPPGAMLVGGEL
jgi:hypothetical protein